MSLCWADFEVIPEDLEDSEPPVKPGMDNLCLFLLETKKTMKTSSQLENYHSNWSTFLLVRVFPARSSCHHVTFTQNHPYTSSTWVIILWRLGKVKGPKDLPGLAYCW